MRIERPSALRSKPTVSVVIPCYNYGRYLPQAVASALDQERVEVEVIVVDDASTDGSADVAHGLAQDDPRIQVIVHAVNRGHIETYNDGLARATGDYVVLLSADDLLTHGALDRAAALFDAHPEVGMVYGFPAYFSDTPKAPRLRCTSWSIWSGDRWTDLVLRRGRNPIISPECVLRRSLLEAVGPYEKSLPHAADLTMWLRAAARMGVGRVNGADQANYRVHADNMHLTTLAGVLPDLRERRAAFEAALGPGPLMDRARRTLAREAVMAAWRARRAGGDGESPDALIAFAVDCSPAVRGTPAWRLATAPGRGTRVRRRVEEAVDGIWWTYRWRRWRRFGT